MRRTIVSILTIASCIFSIGIIIVLLSTIKAPALDKVSITKIYELPADKFLPEPGEHWQYIISTLALPFLCAGFYLIFTHLFSGYEGDLKIIHLLLSLIATAVLILLTVAALLNIKIYLAASSLINKPGLTLVFCATILSVIIFTTKFINRKRVSANRLYDFVYLFAGIAIIVLLVLETTFNEREPRVSGIHFIAYFDSVVQVYLGKTLLVNDTTQYGLYALLLKPIFHLIGLSVFKFTLLMGILKGLAFLSLLSLLRVATKNRWIAFAGFTSLVFYARLGPPVDLITDPYFQYNPNRFIFPAVFLLLVWVYIREKKISRRNLQYFFISLFSALSVLWNPDSGLVVLVSWLICLVYTEMLFYREHKKRVILVNIIKHCMAVCGAMLLALICFYLYTYFSSGSWPGLSGLWAYQKLFAVYGFNMLPIQNIIHPWSMVVVIYILGVFMGVRYFIESTQIIASTVNLSEDEREANKLILAISIIGIGLFSYYVGRSHDYNLIGPSWPVFLLLTIFTDRLFTDLSQVFRGRSLIIALKTYLFSPHYYYKVVLFVILFFLLTSSVLSIATNLPAYLDLISTRASGILAGMPETMHSEINFIKSNSDQGDQILILSNLASELYLYTNISRPLPVPGFGELVLKSDFEKIFNFLRTPPTNAKIFWDPKFEQVNPNQFPDSLSRATSINSLILYVKK